MLCIRLNDRELSGPAESKLLLMHGWGPSAAHNVSLAVHGQMSFLPWLGLSPFFMGDGFKLSGDEPTPTNHWVSCKVTSHQPALNGLQFLPIGSRQPPMVASLSLLALHLHKLEIQTEPPLRKGAAGLLQQCNFVGPRQNQEKPRSCNKQETEAALRILLYHYGFKDSVIF